MPELLVFWHGVLLMLASILVMVQEELMLSLRYNDICKDCGDRIRDMPDK